MGHTRWCLVPCLCAPLRRPAALRHVAHALLAGVESKQASPAALQPVSGSEPGAIDASPVVPSLAYLRDRVCVPRDLKLPAARQFRAHLNWAIDQLTAAA